MKYLFTYIALQFVFAVQLNAQIYDSHIQIIGSTKGLIDRQVLENSWIRIDSDSVIVYSEFESGNKLRSSYYIESRREFEEDGFLQVGEIFDLITSDNVKIELHMKNENDGTVLTFYIPNIETFTIYSVSIPINPED